MTMSKSKKCLSRRNRSNTKNTTSRKESINSSVRKANTFKYKEAGFEVLEALGLTPVAIKTEFQPTEGFSTKTKQDTNNNLSVSAVTVRRCMKCDLGFRSICDYNRHRRRQHPRNGFLHCKICTKTFRTYYQLIKHKQCHSGATPYCCNVCNKTFTCLQLLTVHIRRHDGKPPYTCKICKAGFDTQRDYLTHETVHELKQPGRRAKRKLFKCITCLREFLKLCDLERHSRVHTGEKPYACDVCQRRFQQAHNLTKHMIVHTKEKQFECEICKRHFGRSDVLTRHMITHAVNKPHECEFCGKSFGRTSQLLDHSRKHH